MQLSHWCSATTWFLWLSLEQVNWEQYCTSIGRDERVASRGQHLLVFSQSRRRSPAELVHVMLHYVMEIEVHSNIIIKHTFHTHTKTMLVFQFWDSGLKSQMQPFCVEFPYCQFPLGILQWKTLNYPSGWMWVCLLQGSPPSYPGIGMPQWTMWVACEAVRTIAQQWWNIVIS